MRKSSTFNERSNERAQENNNTIYTCLQLNKRKKRTVEIEEEQDVKD